MGTTEPAAVEGQGRFFDRASAAFRDRRNVGLRDFIVQIIAARAGRSPSEAPRQFRIADLGGSWAYWQRVGIPFLDTHDIEVVCINFTQSELKVAGQSPRLTAQVGDARDLAHFADNSFDLVHSNSVVEHVGTFADMYRFAREVRRLAPAYYVQTPYFWFPIDPHFPRMPLYHWMPMSLRLKIYRRIRVGWSPPIRDIPLAMGALEGTIMLDRQQFRTLFPDGAHSFEWFGLPKSMIATRG
jgi:hypothetical protein